VTDYLALIGDASDNVPGAKGIGPKTALQLIETFGSVDGVLARSGEVTQKRAREAIQASAAQIALSKELVTIQTDLPVTLKLDALTIREPDREKLRRILVDLEFHTLARELDEAEAKPAELDVTFRVIETPDEAAEFIRAVRHAGASTIAVEPSDPMPLRGDLVGIGICAGDDLVAYLPFCHRRGSGGMLDLEGNDQVKNLPSLRDPAMEPVRAWLEDADAPKTGHNLKNDMLVLGTAGVTLAGLDFDTQVASYVIDPGRYEHTLDSLALQHLGHRTHTREDVTGKGRDQIAFAECDVEKARDYVAGAAHATFRLRKILEHDLGNQALDRLFREIEMPLIHVLAAMERRGIRIDGEFFATTGRKLARDLDLIQQQIWKVAGEEFNIGSTHQLRTILFEKLSLPIVRRTKTGPSTDASVLEELAQLGHELPRLILEYRQIDKLKGTYVDALPLQVNPRTGRIHTSFSQTVAATGRLSSNNPNLQNVPIRTDQGAEIRKGFIPADGHLFISADYSQIELRILAHFSGDPAFVEAFRNRQDIHRQTAAIMFAVPVAEVSGQMRAAAKTVNFATIYGIGPFALSHQLGTSVADAKIFIENYFARFPGVRRYLDTQIEHARTHGYVETLSGRRRYIPEIHNRNFNMRQFGERAATNAPVQGSAADIIKIAMIRIHAALAEIGAHMLLQVHDELVFETPADRADETRNMVQELMENAFPLEVPLEVETGVGQNWYECK
jgi:DNA polymerase-1